MAVDILEDIIAFAYATGDGKRKVDETCPVCGIEMEENEDGDLFCPECGV